MPDSSAMPPTASRRPRASGTHPARTWRGARGVQFAHGASLPQRGTGPADRARMCRVSEPTDEFSFLPEQAADAGIEASRSPAASACADPRGRPHAERTAVRRPRHPVVTFLHGAGLNAHTWDTTILALGLPALAIDLPGHGDSSWRADLAYTGARPRARRRRRHRSVDRRAAAARRPVARRPDRRGGRGIPTRSRPRARRSSTSHPGSTPTRARRRSGTSSPARPTGRRATSSSTARSRSGSAVARRAAERGVYFNSRDAPGRPRRVEASLRAPRGGHVGFAASSPPRRAHSRTPSPRCCRRADGTISRTVTAPITLIRGDRGYVTDADAAQFRERVPAASVVDVPSGHNVQEELPVELGARLANARREGLTLLLRSV